VITIRLPWRWRLRRWLGFDSARRAGVLYIPNEITFDPPNAAADALLNHLIKIMSEPLGPLPRWYRWRRFWGCDSVRSRKAMLHATKSMVPIILRGPADAVVKI
jgi:hypothetical protein